MNNIESDEAECAEIQTKIDEQKSKLETLEAARELVGPGRGAA